MLKNYSTYMYMLLHCYSPPPSHTHTDDDNDIIDESLYYFKANVFFKQFEVKVRP